MEFALPILLALGGLVLLGWQPLSSWLSSFRREPEPPPVGPDEHDIKLALISMAMDIRAHLKSSEECVKTIDSCIIPAILEVSDERQ